MEDKIKEFIENKTKELHFVELTGWSMETLIKEAIQFGSLLTIERAKEKINKFSEWNAPFTGMANKEDVLKAIEESKL